MRNVLIILISSIVFAGCEKPEETFKDFNDYQIADIVHSEFPNLFPQPEYFVGEYHHSDYFFFINNIDDFTELITNRGLDLIQPIDFESQTLVGSLSYFFPRSPYIGFSYHVKKDAKNSTFKIDIILTNYGQDENIRYAVNAPHWFILPKIDNASQIVFDKAQNNKDLSIFDTSLLHQSFYGELAGLEENTIDTARVFNIQPLSDKFPNLILSSDFGDDKIEFTSSMIFKYPHKIELYDLLKAYAPPLIVSDYILGRGLYLMDTEELSIEFFKRDINKGIDYYQPIRFKGNSTRAKSN